MEHGSWLLIGLTLLAGCGRLNAFNPDGGVGDDTSDTHVDDTDTDTSDTDTSDTDTQSTSAPSLDTFTARESGDRVEIAFRSSDPDGDLSGGVFELGINGTTTALRIPQDINSWVPGGESKVFIPVSICDGGSSYSFTGRLRDAAGNQSSSRSASLSLSGSAEMLVETGDDPDSATDLSTLYKPAYICGDIYRASNDGESYTGDMDWVIFDPEYFTTHTFTLTWDALDADYDMHLYDSWGYWVASAAADGPTQPEVMQEILYDDYYILGVGGWSGGSGRWMITVQ